MTDERDSSQRREFDTALLDAFDRVRDELRDEIQRSEGRVMTAVHGVQERVEQSEVTHAGIHAVEGESRAIAHARFEDFMRKAELAAARRDGALGILRFAVDLVGRNWRGIAAAGATAWFLLGGVHVQVLAS